MVKKLFLTPPNTPGETQCRSLEIPSSKEWLGIFNNALLQLVNPYNYEQVNDTDLPPQEVADACYLIFQQWLLSTCSPPSEVVDAPFWQDETGDDADDESTPTEQPWFGRWDGETFLESMAYVFLTNFLSSLISPEAAIKYLTIPRTFRLLIKRNPHGAKLLLFLDGGLYAVVNGYSIVDQVGEILIASPGTELMIVHSGEHDPDATPDANGNYTVDVIRSRLTADDVLPPDIRYSGDPPVFQTTFDGGTTWVNTPTTDPRYNPGLLLPPLTHYTGIECDAAARITAQIKDTLDIFIASGEAAQFATGVMALMLAIIGPVGWLLDAFILGGNALVDIGQANIESAFTTGVYDDIQCTISCFIEADGSINQPSLEAAFAKIQADHTGVVASTISKLLFFYGYVPFSNAVVVRDETGDCTACDSCGWFVEYDFATGVHGWQVLLSANQPRGMYTGNQFVGTNQGGTICAFLYKALAGVAITGISAYCVLNHGTGLGSLHRILDVTVLSPIAVTTIGSSGVADRSPVSWEVGTPSFTTTQGIAIDWNGSSNGTGSMNIYKIRLAGTGTPPADGVRVSGLS